MAEQIKMSDLLIALNEANAKLDALQTQVAALAATVGTLAPLASKVDEAKALVSDTQATVLQVAQSFDSMPE